MWVSRKKWNHLQQEFEETKRDYEEFKEKVRRCLFPTEEERSIDISKKIDRMWNTLQDYSSPETKAWRKQHLDNWKKRINEKANCDTSQ